MRYPSVDRIESVCGVDRQTAIKVRRLIDGRDDHPELYVEQAVAHLLGTHGVEVIRSADRWDHFYGDVVAVYCNTGDIYDGTLLYDVERGVWYATSVGDWIETAERNRRFTGEVWS